MALRPLAKTSPRALFWANWAITCSLGTPWRETEMASCSRFSGAILLALSEIKRSTMSAKAKIEQAIRGQMGQPAAWMMVSNVFSPRGVGENQPLIITA